MLKKAISVIALAILVLQVQTVNAQECSYDKQVELNDLAATVKATYEEVEIDTGRTQHPVDEEGMIDTEKEIPLLEKGFKVKILNITEELYVRITDGEGLNRTYKYSDTNNGTIELEARNADTVRNYRIEILAAKDNCAGTSLRNAYVVTPKYNLYSEYQFCKEHSNLDYCSEYTTSDTLSLDSFLKKIENYKDDAKNKKNENDKKGIINFIKENKILFIIITSIVVIAGVATAAIIVIKRRSRLI